MNIHRTLSAKETFVIFVTFAAFLAAIPATYAEGPAALSPTVAAILEKADADIREAERPDLISTYLDAAAYGWIGDAVSTLTSPLDTKRDVIREEQSMFSETACFRYDQKVIEWKMNDVRKRIDKAVNDKSVTKILPLEAVYRFLSAKLNTLERGGLDPDVWEYEASSDATPRSFANDVAPPKKMCYFHSDYAPTSAAGYGCDTETLQWIVSQLPQDAGAFRESTEAELRAMEAAQTIVTAQEGAREAFRRILDHVDVLVLGTAPAESGDMTDEEPASSLPAREHKTQSGCRDAVEDGVILHALRGPFDVDVNDSRLTLDFPELRRKLNEGRPVSDLYTPKKDGFEFNLMSHELPALVRQFTDEQTAWGSVTFAAGADPLLAMEDAFGDLRAAVGRMVKLGNSLDGGLRGFVRDFAYFLRRSCLDRPCGIRLDTVLKLVFADSCFAYGNGEYKNATVGSPQWRKCMQEAGL